MNGLQGKINEITCLHLRKCVYVCVCVCVCVFVRSLRTLLVKADFTSNEFGVENTCTHAYTARTHTLAASVIMRTYRCNDSYTVQTVYFVPLH